MSTDKIPVADWRTAALHAFLAIKQGYEPTPQEAADGIDILRDYGRQKEVLAAKLAQRLADVTRGINDQLAPEIKRQKAEAWEQGHLRCACDKWSDLPCSNPYRGDR